MNCSEVTAYMEGHIQASKPINALCALPSAIYAVGGDDKEIHLLNEKL